MALLVLVLSLGGLEEVDPSMSSGGVQLPKQNWGLFPRGTGKPFWL